MIAFLHPWVLAGLAAAGIPILLHLVQRREPPTVVFPAVRYLVAATQAHQRRLKLQNWLLLLLRTLLIVALVLAAAGPSAPARGVPGHAPSALVLVLDNSASSAAVVNGTARLTRLEAAARQVLARATADDALWLILADGVPRRGDPMTLGQLIDSAAPSPRRLDLGLALGTAEQVLGAESRPGEVALVSDLQASAVSPADITTPLLIARPADAAPRNVGIGSLAAGTQPWSSDGGRAVVSVVGDSGPAVPVSVRLGERPGRQALASVGGSVTVTIPGAPSGWWILTAETDADELRLDDRRVGVVRIAPVARVRWDPAERYVAAAAEVLERNRRIARGDEVTIGRLAAGTSVVEPPADPAELGALNRALGRRGAGWRFGALVAGAEGRREAGGRKRERAGAGGSARERAGPAGGGTVGLETTDSGAGLDRLRVLKRYTLEPSGSGRTGVIATVGGAPWIVRSDNVVLLGSRLDPAWTELPVAAGFMPFMDFLLNRAARGEVALVEAAPGDQSRLPDRVTEVRRGTERWTVEGGAAFHPTELGVYYLLAGHDTVGALTANLDPREVLLARAPDDQVRKLWRGARVVDLDDAGHDVFSAGARGDLRAPLLWAGLLLGLTEVGLASGWRRQP